MGLWLGVAYGDILTYADAFTIDPYILPGGFDGVGV